jgi:hypothetical protein
MCWGGIEVAVFYLRVVSVYERSDLLVPMGHQRREAMVYKGTAYEEENGRLGCFQRFE